MTKKALNETHHIALFLPALDGGGAERVMLTLAGAFARRGMRVDLVVTAARGTLINDIPDSVRLVNLGASRIAMSLPGLVKYFRTERPTEMLSALSSTNCIAQLAKVLSRASTRLVVVEHSTLSHSVRNDVRKRVRMMPALMQLTYPYVNAVVTVSAGVADDLANTIRLRREDIRVIYNPVVSDSILEKIKEPLTHPWFQDGEPPVVLAVGRLTAAKDFETLIKAFGEVRKERSARLLILGEGELRPDLESLVESLGIKSDVSLPGFVINPYSYMSSAKIFVLSSRWEGLGNVLIEAMACGLPVISTDCPSGPSEILENGRYGTLVNVGDVSGIATEIIRIIDSGPNECLEAVIDRARDFSVDNAVDQYADVLFGGDCA